jgi:tripartite-type tricarboxylate transporter receptor subunit TctC
MRDMAPVVGISRAPLIMAVNPSFPAKTAAEFIAHAKGNPGKINMGSAGIGSAGHLAGELLQMMTGIKLIHVPYRGNAPAVTDLIAGQVQLVFPSSASAMEYVRTGKLRGLAVTGATRLAGLPDLPTLAESIPGYEASSLYGIGAPRGTPAEIVDRLNKEVNAALADPKMKARLADLGGAPFGGSPEDFGRLIADETEKWGKVVRFAGAKPQ